MDKNTRQFRLWTELADASGSARWFSNVWSIHGHGSRCRGSSAQSRELSMQQGNREAHVYANASLIELDSAENRKKDTSAPFNRWILSVIDAAIRRNRVHVEVRDSSIENCRYDWHFAAAPDTRDMAIQCERDDDMTTRLLDLSKQGVTEFHESVLSHVQTAPY